MDDVAWGALTLTLTALGVMWTWFALRRRGPVSALRAAGFTLLPLAAYLTNTLRMFTRIVDAVASWATTLVFDPFVWLGTVLGATGLLMIGTARFLRRRGQPHEPGRTARLLHRGPRKELPPSSAGAGATGNVDDDLADIEALLRKRGIS
ncbi:MAG TPA: hypothetical protein VFT00_02375 [Nocardioides sp.]|nr:hypothetical protein [Nocardioides sp.]